MNYTYEELKELMMEQDYPMTNKEMINSVISQLSSLCAEANSAFVHWQQTNELPEFDINGVTPDYLKDVHKATDIAIILAYDGLIKNPQSAYLFKKPIIKHN